MDCQETQKRMMDFVRRRMDDDDLEEFLAHIDTCKECYEELQIDYCVYEGIKMLDEDSKDSFNIQQAFDNDIRQSKDKLRRKHRLRKAILVCVVLIVCLLLGALLLYSGIELPYLFRSIK